MLLEKVWQDRGFPVDPVAIATEIGIQVRHSNLPQDVSGAIIKKPGEDPVILVASTDSRQRKRFTVAHELGHFMYQTGGQADEIDEFEFVDFRSELSAEGIKGEEIYANQFAANLLMPAKEVKRRSGDASSAFELALWFGVSADAMSFRLQNLGITI